jgi:hypothetical protein
VGAAGSGSDPVIVANELDTEGSRRVRSTAAGGEVMFESLPMGVAGNEVLDCCTACCK